MPPLPSDKSLGYFQPSASRTKRYATYAVRDFLCKAIKELTNMRRPTVSMALVICALVSCPALLYAQENAKNKIKPRIQPKAQSFSLREVRLLDGPFREAMLRDQKFLLGIDNDRLLHNFRVNAGLPSSAKPYGGWE